MAPSVLVVDDHAGFRAEARELLHGDGFDVVGEAPDGAAAIRAAALLKPDLVLLDVGLPDMSGFDLVGPLRDASPGSLVVLISSRRKQDFGGRIIASGAEWFLEKSELRPGMLDVVLKRG